MDDRQKKKLERYLRNADFLWGLIVHLDRLESDNPPFVMNQTLSYYMLRAKFGLKREDGKDFRGTYADITRQLIDRYGIEGILSRVVVPQVTEKLFNAKTIKYLRNCWYKHEWPKAHQIAQLNPQNRHAYPFLLWNRQHKFFEGWSAFAHIYFEEIESNFGSKGVRNEM